MARVRFSGDALIVDKINFLLPPFLSLHLTGFGKKYFCPMSSKLQKTIARQQEK